MASEVVMIDAHTVELHEPFLRFIPRVFPHLDFRRWYEWGGWPADYRAFAIFAGDEISANVSVQRMDLRLNAHALSGWQLGAVGVLPDLRGRGLQRQLITHVLSLFEPSDRVFLYANEEVLDFYPLFGFRQVTESLFGIDLPVDPAPSTLRRLSVESAADRALLSRIAATAAPVTERFGAADYGGVLLWYWTNFHQAHFFYHAGDDAIVVAEEDMEVLRILDVLATRTIDLPAYLPQLVTQRTEHFEFAFTPEKYWPGAAAIHDYLESSLFVLGSPPFPAAPFKFPVLAQT